ncbi:unnamed protein product, partial [Trichobilharzia regenti]
FHNIIGRVNIDFLFNHLPLSSDCVYYCEYPAILTKFYILSILIYRYIRDIYVMSGTEDMAKKYGPWFVHNMTARANIFRRDHHKVVDFPSMMKLMRLVLLLSLFAWVLSGT